MCSKKLVDLFDYFNNRIVEINDRLGEKINIFKTFIKTKVFRKKSKNNVNNKNDDEEKEVLTNYNNELFNSYDIV